MNIQKRYRAAIHIRKAVPALDINRWHGRVKSPNVVSIRGPAHNLWDDEVEAYHKTLPAECADTKREHEKAKKQAKNESLHYELHLPESLIIDNFLCSADHTKIDCMRWVVSKAGGLATGFVAWVCAFEGQDIATDADSDLVDIEALMKSACLLGSSP